MHDLSETILSDYQVRKSRKQKEAFRALLGDQLRAAGYAVEEERSGSLVPSINVVVGNLEHAEYVFTAHYDTCAVMPVPNFIAPKNIVLSLAYQLLLTVAIIAIAGAAGGLVGYMTRSVVATEIAYLLVLFGLIFCMMAGPANLHTANDNTSGVIVLTEALLSLPEAAREKAAFVFFDNEELGLLGSSAFKKKHGSRMAGKTLINFDCVSDGDHLLLLPSKALRKDTAGCDHIEAALRLPEGKTGEVSRKGLALYPSDQMHFKRSVGVVALRREPVIGYYLSRIHTARDTRFDRANIETFRAFAVACITEVNPIQ